MSSGLQFTSPTEPEPGTVFALLSRSWRPLWNPELEDNLRRFDREVYESPETVGACTFITCLGDQPIGMASYDPRQGPERGIIGYNCIVPVHQRKGYGRRQIREILRIFRRRHIRKAWVTTSEAEFFIPAQGM